jgi:hypothetical protein
MDVVTGDGAARDGRPYKVLLLFGALSDLLDNEDESPNQWDRC